MATESPNLLYFAYGEHMNVDEMQQAFPHARLVGHARLEGFRLCFIGRDGMARAALEPDPRESVPGCVWSLYETDADALDRVADDPFFARREIRSVRIDGMLLPVLVYITVPGQHHGRPGFVTYDLMREAYETAGEDMNALREMAMLSAP